MTHKTSRRIQPKAKPPSREELLERLARKTQENHPDREVRFIENAGEKMSDVLEEFLDPYFDEVQDDNAYQKLIQFGVLAWNTALLDKETQKEAVGEMAELAPVSLRQDFRNTMWEMIARKQRHFAHNRRRIIDYQLTDLGGEWHLSVVSSPPPEELE